VAGPVAVRFTARRLALLPQWRYDACAERFSDRAPRVQELVDEERRAVPAAQACDLAQPSGFLEPVDGSRQATA
jgi:hypothetical protein